MQKFKNNEIVCFLGDSITNNNEWQMQIYQHYLKSGAKNLKIFCCGTSGATAKQGYTYKNIDLYKYNPTHVSIMYGINDLRPSLYSNDADKKMIEQREKRFEDYEYYMRKLIDEMLEKGISVSLCTPMPYDSGLLSAKGKNYHMCSEAVEKCAEFIRTISKEHSIEYVDFNKTVTKINRELQKAAPDVSLISQDRIHPTHTGYNVMARIYLCSQGFIDVSVPTPDEILGGNVQALEIGDKILERSIPEGNLRRLISTEWMKIVENDFSKFNESAEKLVEIMKEHESIMNDDTMEYFKISIPFYVKNKCRQEEFFKDVIRITNMIVKGN